MNPAAIEHAQVRLNKARLSHQAMLDAKDPTTMDAAWSDFLIAASGIYSKFEQGSKSNPKSTGWFGRKKKERKDDPLLSYLHHARNSDEHGIEAVTIRNKGGWGINPSNPELPMSFDINPSGVPIEVGQMLIVNHDPANPPVVDKIPPSIRLTRVTDSRFGDSFDPPRSHQGSELQDSSLGAVAQLAITYLERMVEEAKALA